LLASPAVAFAQAPADEAGARALFNDGNTLFYRGEYAGALEKFQAAYARWSSPKILPNIGTTLRQLGRYTEAVEAYERYLAQPTDDAKQRDQVRVALAETLTKTGQIAVSFDDPAASLLVDAKPVRGSDTVRVVRVDPGTHEVRVEVPGQPPKRREVQVVAGQTQTVAFNDRGAGGPPPPASAPPPAPQAERGASIAPWIAGGVAVGGLAAGGIFFALRQSAVSRLEQDCIDDVCPDSAAPTVQRADTMGALSVAGVAIGVAGVAALVVLLITDDEPGVTSAAVEPARRHRFSTSSSAVRRERPVRLSSSCGAFGVCFEGRF
jgi:hypothetical protein